MIKKLNRVPSLICVAVLSLGLGLSVTARADDDEQGGEIEGTESLDIEVNMTPTAAAPAGSSIEVSLEGDDEAGQTSATLKFDAKGLPAGTYNVNATLKSNGSVVSVGSFTSDGSPEIEVEFGTSEGLPLPAGFNPFDIATVTVSDSNNVVLFTADFTNVTSSVSSVIAASVNAVAGVFAPQATGHVTLSAHAVNGVATGSLTITGASLPARAKLLVAVNGGVVKKATVDSTGNLNVIVTPKGKSGTIGRGISLFGVKTVTVRDASGSVALSAGL